MSKRSRGKLVHDVACLAPVLLICAAIALHGASLQTFFAQDDITFLARASNHAPHLGAARLLSIGGIFRLEFVSFGLDPFGYHATNLLIHLVNVVGVYALSMRLRCDRITAAGAALLFGASSIVFTPLHWASGVIELSSAGLVILTTLLFLKSLTASATWAWVSALALLAAMLAKESASAWVLAAGFLASVCSERGVAVRRLLPPGFATVAFLCVLFIGGTQLDHSRGGAYAMSFRPESLLQNLTTYAYWSVAVWIPVRDLIAAADSRSLWMLVPMIATAAVLAIKTRAAGTQVRLVLAALVWWVAFLLPVIPLAHHTYLYYLYIPWICGAIGVACALRVIATRLKPAHGRVAFALAALSFAVVEWRSTGVRANSLHDHLPVDRTLREAELLRNAIGSLTKLELQPGTRIGFVNPVPRAVVGRADDVRRNVGYEVISYMPLEAAMREGETLKLFFPSLEYVGFATTIPEAWTDVECLYYEQRGWLRSWGKGQPALLSQAQVELEASRWEQAAVSFHRARLLGDTLRVALEGQLIALRRSDRQAEASRIASEIAERWPTVAAPR